MDIRPLPAGHSGLGVLQALVGSGFAAALQDGLSRSVPPYAPAPTARSGLRFTAPARGTRPARGADDAGVPETALLPREAQAILRRFEERLHAALDLDHELELDTLAVRATLTLYARTVLADAQDIAAGRPAAAPRAVPALTPALTSTAGALLTECALLHFMASAHSGNSGSALPRATALMKPLGQALRRHLAATTGPADTDDDMWRDRRRLARDLHDELGTHMALALHRIGLQAARDTDAAGHLAAASVSLRSALRHVGSLVAGLREETAVPALGPAVEAFAAQGAPETVRVTFSGTGDEYLLPDARRRELFLAVRECLRNSFEHAAATEVSVTSRVTRRWCYVRVADNGVGFDPEAAGREGSHGLHCLRERIEEMGGRVTVGSAPGEGTQIALHVPLPVRP